ncbi:helix-turn-helix transcriptional regulator [Solibacillus sp. FSL K6-1523]|uniref:helix-turn-helix transcriptional regulator n=1 Tax=Solibacillus sp. FSL K6-1523 TaxID=2921471 RepID=UPI0030F896E6
MKTERLFSILIYLLQKKKVSAEQLASQFEVSKRTIYRDIDALCSIGIPIISYLGKNGGFTLIDTYKLDKFTFSEEEKRFLLQVLSLKSELFDVQQLATLQRKLELLKDNNQDGGSNISIASSTLHRQTIENETKVKIQNILPVIEQRYKMSISYVSQTANISNRIIQPIKLNFMNGSWYLEAYCEVREALRLFKLTRIRNMQIIKDTTRATNFEETAQSSTKSVKMEEIRLSFSKSELGKLYDFFMEDEITLLENGQVNVTFTYDTNKNMLPFLLMFGRHVKVLAPEWLKNNYMSEIKFIFES